MIAEKRNSSACAALTIWRIAGASYDSTPLPSANVSNFSQRVRTNNSGRSSRPFSRFSTPAKTLPSGSPPDTSITEPFSNSLQRPTASKFSRAKPMGSIRSWQLAQAGLARCSARRSLIERVASTLFSSRAGTFGGGGGGGEPMMFSSTQLPRITGRCVSHRT